MLGWATERKIEYSVSRLGQSQRRRWMEQQAQALPTLRDIGLQTDHYTFLDFHLDPYAAIPPLTDAERVEVGREGNPDLAEGTDYPNAFAIDIDGESAEAWISGPLSVLEDLDRPLGIGAHRPESARRAAPIVPIRAQGAVDTCPSGSERDR